MERQNTNLLLDYELPAFESRQESLAEISLFGDDPDDQFESQEIQPDNRREINQQPSLQYRDNFINLVKDDTLYVASLDINELQRQEQGLIKGENLLENQLKEKAKRWKSMVRKGQKEANANIEKSYADQKQTLDDDKKTLISKTNDKTKVIDDSFKLATVALENVLKKRKNDTKKQMGKVFEYKEVIKRRDESRLVYITIQQGRAIKNRLPIGQYVILITLWNKLSGSRLEFVSKKVQIERRITNPVHHGGQFFHSQLKFEDVLMLRIPKYRNEVYPSMIISFEMFLLKGQILDYDKEVAWGVFPLCNSDFNVSEGKFKIPMIKGKIDERVTKFCQYESIIHKNLNQWIFNLYFDMSLSEVMAPQKSLSSPDDYEDYSYAVIKADGLMHRHAGYKKIKFVISELFAEYGSKWKHYKYATSWIAIFTLFLAFWFNRFTHTFGQWLFLTMVDVEITKYVPAWFSFRIEYSSDATWGIICGFIISGGLFSIIFFSLCVLLSYLSRKVLKGFPNVLYRCIANFGIAMIFEPLITFIQSILIYAIEDDINQEPFQLSLYYTQWKESYSYGPTITLMIYILLFGLGLSIFYFYVHKIHNDGSLPDNYLRLTAPEHYFHIPYDSEVSKTYLKSVIKHAHKFNSNGVTREISVVNYKEMNYKSGQEKERQQVYSIISIYNVQSGERQLYRNFMRLSNGAICELSTFQYRSYQDVAKELEWAGLKQVQQQKMDELKEMVIQNLDQSGYLDSIRNELRANVFKTIQNEENNVRPPPPQVNKLFKTEQGKLCGQIFKEFLECFKMNYTLNVFLPECGMSNEELDTNLQDDLGVQPDPGLPLINKLIQLVKERQNNPAYRPLPGQVEDDMD